MRLIVTVPTTQRSIRSIEEKGLKLHRFDVRVAEHHAELSVMPATGKLGTVIGLVFRGWRVWKISRDVIDRALETTVGCPFKGVRDRNHIGRHLDGRFANWTGLSGVPHQIVS